MKVENLAKNQIVINEGNKSTFNSYGVNVAQKENGQITLDEKILGLFKDSNKVFKSFSWWSLQKRNREND